MNEYELFIRECKKQIAVRGLTQYRVADMTGKTQAFVNKFLNGHGTILSTAMFDMARVLGVDLGKIQREAGK